jgi:hypothetical protein
MLRRVGFFREVEPDEVPDAPSLVDAVGKLPGDLRRPVARYLMSGSALAIGRRSVPDFFDPSREHIGYPHRLTDGVWEWAEYLAYYVAEYGAGLPADFITTMRANDWTPPSLSAEDVLVLRNEPRKYA